jgi:hypothetical protein
MPSSLARISVREESAGFERREGGGRGTRPTLSFGLSPLRGQCRWADLGNMPARGNHSNFTGAAEGDEIGGCYLLVCRRS